MNLVSWNCRGLGNPSKIEAVKDLLKAEPSDILLLQETKIEGQALLEISSSKWKKRSGKAVSSRGTSGGLATLWTEDLFHLNKHHETQHWIFTELNHKASKLSISLFNLYVPVSYSEKRECWNTLAVFLEETSPSNIIIAGDLNIVMKAKEKRGGTSIRDPLLAKVEEITQTWDLLDFSPVRGIYTWSNNRVGLEHISARLDRFLVQSSIMMDKKIITTKILPKLTSDHKPIQLLLEEEEDLGPIPFRFSPQWIERDGFTETVKTAWARPFSGSSSYVWEQKLKATKQALKEWIKKPAPTPTEKRREAVQSLQTLQIEMESTDITAELLEKEIKEQRSTHQSFRKEEEYWRLKSRSLWLKAGDRNTSFFHRQYRARLSRNHIAEIKTGEGQVCKGFNQVKDAAEAHFRNLYRESTQSSEEETADFLSNIPSLISLEDNAILCRPTTEEEIINVVWSMDADKAPGPDGFTIHFYKTCWHIIKEDLQKMISGFMKKAKVGGGTNSTYLALIPKDSSPDSFARFRPISLCNASYKILAKLLANRIKPLLKRLISSPQGGFVEGRHILDNVIQVQETIHSSKQRKEKGMLIKLDMANAFDRVNRAFLCKVLLTFGFSPHFVQLIKACIDNPWIAPLVNGRPTNFFQAQRGIRQGCPLSPFLYILMADSLSRKLTAERLVGNIPGLKPSARAEPLNHALFADDSLLLGGASIRIAKAFDTVLRNYCKVSGALVNESKSEVFSWNISQHELTGITTLLGFKGHTNWDRFKYLGLPIISGVNKRSLWSDVISKIKSKISAWGGYWLTKGGKVILIKSLLSALPIYQAAFLLAPRNVTEQISKLLRDFLWQGGKGNEKKMHLVSWEVVKNSMAEGGLQIRDPALVNLALGGKILWKLFHEPTHPVSDTLHAKYRPNKTLSNLQTESSVSCTQVWNLCCKSSNFFKKLLYRSPGNGKRTHLWLDRIMGREPLAENEDITDLRDWLQRAGVNRLYDLSKWDEHGDWAGWDFHGVPARLSQQLSTLEDMLEDAAPVNRTMKDSWGWGQTGVYTMAEGYRNLQASRNNSQTPAFWKSVWEPLAVPKVNFFFWTLVHNKLLTGDNLEKRNIAGPHRCVLCNNNSETAQHLFMDCSFAKEVWGLILKDLQISLHPQNSVAELFASWSHIYPQRIPSKSFWSKIWTAIPKYVCWQIWLARNQQIFKEMRHSPMQVAAKAKSFLLEAAQQQYFKEDTSLLPEERRWLGPLVPYQGKLPLSPQSATSDWRLRDDDDTFQSWWRSQNLSTIFFDGASKGNPGVAGAGGVIYSPKGFTKDCFCWGLGQKTNNQAEMLGLIKACHIAREKGIKDLQVFGDSEIIIKNLNKETRFSNASLNKILDRLKRVLQDFNSCKLYHILRTSNTEADQMANKGSILMKGLLIVNNERFAQTP
jgi:ribonuclease HI/exonuclease III